MRISAWRRSMALSSVVGPPMGVTLCLLRPVGRGFDSPAVVMHHILERFALASLAGPSGTGVREAVTDGDRAARFVVVRDVELGAERLALRPGDAEEAGAEALVNGRLQEDRKSIRS